MQNHMRTKDHTPCCLVLQLTVFLTFPGCSVSMMVKATEEGRERYTDGQSLEENRHIVQCLTTVF